MVVKTRQAMLEELDAFFASHSYVSGHSPTQLDVDVFRRAKSAGLLDVSKFLGAPQPHWRRWCRHVDFFAPELRAVWPDALRGPPPGLPAISGEQPNGMSVAAVELRPVKPTPVEPKPAVEPKSPASKKSEAPVIPEPPPGVAGDDFTVEFKVEKGVEVQEVEDAIRCAAPAGSGFWTGSKKLPMQLGKKKLRMQFRGAKSALDEVLGHAAKLKGVMSAEV